jgi:protein phosphatase
MSSADPDPVEISNIRSTASAVTAEPASAQVSVEFGAATHPGLVRPNNEDSYLITRAERSLETLLTNLPPSDIPTWAAERSYGLVVADGMGGAAAGEVASQFALRTVVEHVLSTADWIMRDAAAHSIRIEARIADRFAAADKAIQEQISRHPNWFGMGTTMTLALSYGSNLFLGHVGDSRAYLLRDKQLKELTHDHTFAQALADMGSISQQEAAAHRLRNVLLRDLGGSRAQPDVRHLSLESNDQLLLCTDGLTDLVPTPTISNILQAAPSAQAACDELVAAALAAGGKDNVTALLARYSWLK